jgi:hypothetical protein
MASPNISVVDAGQVAPALSDSSQEKSSVERK